MEQSQRRMQDSVCYGELENQFNDYVSVTDLQIRYFIYVNIDTFIIWSYFFVSLIYSMRLFQIQSKYRDFCVAHICIVSWSVLNLHTSEKLLV
jgi:hypothetical protein